MALEKENGGFDELIFEEMKALNQELGDVETELEKQKIKALKPIYEKRRKIFKKIPKFWTQVFMKRASASFGQYLGSDDYPVIQFIDDVIVESNENSIGSFKIIFSFSENDFFKNKELMKEFIVDADGQRKIKGTPIEWYDGRDYTKKRKADEDEDEPSLIKWFSEENPDDVSWEVGRVLREEVYPQAWAIYDGEYDDDEDDDDEEGEANPDYAEESEEDEFDLHTKKRVKQ